MKRVQFEQISNDLAKKMVLVTGPRQVGKTFLATCLVEQQNNSLYLNYDKAEDREIIQSCAWLDSTELLVLDELHKMPDWKNYLKGVYDTKPKHLTMLITGSARLDIFNKVGDSLAGRYYLHRLMPLSLAELHQLKLPVDIDLLMSRGGFPEPYLAKDPVTADRWRMQYINSMLSTDVFTVEQVNNINALRTVFELLRTRVGSPISYQSIANDVGISATTVKRYIEILEALFIVFRVTPYSKNIARSLLKEPKIYFFDTGLVKDDIGMRLENTVAVALLKHVYAKIDSLGQDYALHYLRTKDGMEVDFALVKQNRIIEILEVKNANHDISKSLYYFAKKYNLPAVQLVNRLKRERKVDEVTLRRLSDYLMELMC